MGIGLVILSLFISTCFFSFFSGGSAVTTGSLRAKETVVGPLAVLWTGYLHHIERFVSTFVGARTSAAVFNRLVQYDDSSYTRIPLLLFSDHARSSMIFSLKILSLCSN